MLLQLIWKSAASLCMDYGLVLDYNLRYFRLSKLCYRRIGDISLKSKASRNIDINNNVKVQNKLRKVTS